MDTFQRDHWLSCFLAEAEISRMESVLIPVSSKRALGLITLLMSWRSHVIRIEGELDLPDSDRAAWGVYDLIAAFALRSFLAHGIEIVDSTSSDGLMLALGDVDSRLKEFTEIDESGLVRRIDGVGRPSNEWWWDRVPYGGPIRRDIDRIRSQA